MAIIILSAAWLAGIFLGSKLHLPPLFLLAGLLPLPLLPFSRRHGKAIILLSLGIIVLSGAAIYSHQSLRTVTEHDLRFYRDRGPVEVRGMVARDPETGGNSAHVYLAADQVRVNENWHELKGTALLFVPLFSEYRYGDLLRVSGELEAPPQFADFDYPGYLAGKGIYATMLHPRIEVTAREQGSPVLSWIYAARNRSAGTLSRILPEPQASLAQGIILGIRGNIPAPVRENFVHTGTAHLLAISGLHLGIIAGIALSAGLWLFGRRRYLYVWLALAAVWFYALFTGMNPPVVRGATMASLFLIAELLGRQRSAIVALTFAAAVMVGISPYLLANASFQLSFLAMAGLVFFFPVFRSAARRTVSAAAGETGTLAATLTLAGDSLSVTLAALPPVIITGVVAAVLGTVFLPAAQVAGWLLWLPLSYLLLVTGGLAAQPLASLGTGAFSPLWLLGYYSLLAVAVLLLRQSPLRATGPVTAGMKSAGSLSLRPSQLSPGLVIPLLSAAAVLVWAAALALPDGRLHVNFLDVGQGDAILIQKGNQQVLIDGGPGPRALNVHLGRHLPFWDRTIELVVLTHPDQDHLAGLLPVLENFRVQQVLHPDLEYASPLYEQWETIIEQKNIGQAAARAGLRIELDEDTAITVLHPDGDFSSDKSVDADNSSVVLRLVSGEVSFLFTADIRREAELRLVTRREEIASTVLKVSHHGSDTSTSAEFLAAAAPQLSVISVAADNPYGHPDDRVIRRLSEHIAQPYLFRTDIHGTVEFITDGERLWVKTKRAPSLADGLRMGYN